MTTIFINCQRTCFREEISQLKKQSHCSPKSPIATLNPFLDQQGVLRVGGRLNHATMSFKERHPIILPKTHHVTSLIIAEAHRIYCHAGASLLMALLRQNYWIIGARNLIRKTIYECILCVRFRGQTSTQLMGDLPSARVNSPRRAFMSVGVDYAGPLAVKATKGRGQKTHKAYIALFVCMATKAIHIELVSDLSTETFAAALQRFISRRGVPAEMYSDNGTTFVGAHREMSEWYHLIQSETHNEIVAEFLAKSMTAWHFIPPAAPHQGGIWESAIKQTKNLLKKITFNINFTFEELYTFLSRIECILNCRPLCPLSEDVNDLSALTPSHFLIGEPLTSLPEPSLLDTEVNRLSRWQHISALSQGFWRRWRQEYLGTLQNRPKWKSSTPNLQEGDLVILKDDNTPPCIWPLGRITKCHPGHDGHVRVVELKIKSGICKRPVTKLIKLPNARLSETNFTTSSTGC